MNAPAVLLGAAALVIAGFFFLVCGFHLRVDSASGVWSLKLEILCFRIPLYPTDPEKALKKQKKKALRAEKKAKKAAEKAEKQAAREAMKQAAGPRPKKKAVKEKAVDQGDDKGDEKSARFSGMAAKLKKGRSLLAVLLPGLYDAARITVRNVSVVVGGPDAAQAAVRYGAVCGAAETLRATCRAGRSAGKITGKKIKFTGKISVAVDYTSERMRAEADILLSLRVYKVLYTLLRAAKVYFFTA